jgi:hypothetical protein
MPLLCYRVKYLFYIPPVLVAWRRATRQTGAFAITYIITLRFSVIQRMSLHKIMRISHS